MLVKKKEQVSAYCFENLSQFPRLNHAVFTRLGGVSEEPFKSSNVSFSSGDDPKNVLENRRKIATFLGVELKDYVVSGLVHGDKVVRVTKAMRGSGSDSPDTVIAGTDAMITNEGGLCLMVPVADCVPIIIYDPKKNVVGIVHAGWKGTIAEITHKTIGAMVKEFGSTPQDLIAGIGPSICVKHYEVGEDVITSVQKAFPNKDFVIQYNESTGKGFFDLWEANVFQLVESGVLRKNVEVSGICNFERTVEFFSHRAEGKTGRFAVCVVLNK